MIYLKFICYFTIFFELVLSIQIGPFHLSDVVFQHNGEYKRSTTGDFHETLSLFVDKHKRSVDKRTSEKRQHRKRRSVLDFLENKIGVGSNYTLIGPRCIPLQSENINANPYHRSLLSVPGAFVRRGLGLPSILPLNPVICPADSIESCTFVVSKSISVSVTDSYAVSYSGSRTFAKSIGKSDSKGKSTSYTNSIGKTIEESLSRANTLTEEDSLADTVSQSIQNTHEESSGLSRTHTSEQSGTSTLTQELTDSQSVSSEVSISNSMTSERSSSQSNGGSKGSSSSKNTEISNTLTVGASATAKAEFLGIGVEATASVSNSFTAGGSWGSSVNEESNWNNQFTNSQSASNTKSESKSTQNGFSSSIGRSNSRTNTFSDSSTEDNRVSDSISVTKEAAQTRTRVESNSQTDTNSLSNAYRIDDSYSSSDETSISRTLNDDNSTTDSISNETSSSLTITTTLSQDITFPVAPGKCKIAVCFPFVRSIALPFDCLGLDGSSNIINAEYMIPDVINDKVSCTFGLINCEDREKAGIFLVDSVEYKTSDSGNSLEYGEEVAGEDFYIASIFGSYSLYFTITGNLVLKMHDVILWENGMGFFEDYDDMRIRINEKGHLVQEVKGLFNQTVPNYRPNEWITVWSSVSINMNTTIGVPVKPGEYSPYRLILESSGQLNLYDAVGTIIWTPTIQGAQHMFGYKFPEVYLVPTNMITPWDLDKHNQIEGNIVYRNNMNAKLGSLDANCSNYLVSNEALVSPNGRFKLILQESGNLVLKDAYRTMWESTSADLPYTRRPYQLILTPTGDLMVIDPNLFVVWKSVSFVANTTRPYKLEVLDEGRMVIYDANKTEIWESWPIRNMSKGVTFFAKLKYRFVPCHGEGPKNKSILISNNDNKLENEQLLRSSNGSWEFLVSEFSKVSLRYNGVNGTGSSHNSSIFNNENSTIKEFRLESNGLFNLYDVNNTILLTIGDAVLETNGPFTLILRDDGNLTAEDVNNITIWTYPVGLGSVKSVLNSVGDNKLINNQDVLRSNNSEWDLFLFQSSLLAIRNNGTVKSVLYNKTGSNLRNLILKINGAVGVFNSSGSEVYSLGPGQSTGSYAPFSLQMSNTGVLTVLDKSGKNIWSHPRYEDDTFVDNFITDTFDKTKWNLVSGLPNSRGRLQTYATNEVWQSAGILTVKSSKTVNGATTSYKTGRVNTKYKFDFLYGEVEWAVKLPVGKGVWSSIGLSDYTVSNTPIEIVMELKGDVIDQITAQVYYNSVTSLLSTPYKLPNSQNFTTEMHTLRMVWEPEYLAFFVDNNIILSICDTTKIPKTQMFLTLDVSVGGNYAGAPTAQTVFPAIMYVDYVTVKKLIGTSARVLKKFDDYNYNMRLNNEIGSNTQTSVELCHESCKTNSTCQGSSFFLPNRCYLFGYSYTVTHEQSWRASFVKCQEVITPYIHSHVRLLNEFSKITSTSADTCWNSCVKDSNCIATTYNANQCHLFNSSYQFEKTRDWTSHVFKRLNLTNGIYTNGLRLFDDYYRLNTATAEDCWKECNKNTSCTASSYSSINTVAKCFLFTSTYRASYDIDYVTYSTNVITKRDFDIIKHSKVNSPAAYMSLTNIQSPEACFTQCLGVASCAASEFVPSTGKCRLFTTFILYYVMEIDTLTFVKPY